MFGMKYPMTNNWLEYERTDDGLYEVNDWVHGITYTMGELAAQMLHSLDGYTDPYKANPAYTREEVDSFIENLESNHLLRHSRVNDFKCFGTLYCTVFVPRRKLHIGLAKTLNAFLGLSFLPLLVVSVMMFPFYPRLSDDYLISGEVIGLILGLVLHEMAHAIAGFAAYAKIYEAGVMIHNFLPGAYVMIDTASVKSRWKRIQIITAGVEMNIWFGSLCFLLMLCFPILSGALFMAAFVNFLLAASNLAIVDGYDGESIISEILGTDRIVGHAKQVMRSKKRRKQLWERGASGRLEVICYIGVLIAQISLPIYLLQILYWFIGWVLK